MRSWLQPEQLEPLEIRNAVLDAIEELVQPLGDGRRALVHDRIVVRLLTHDDARRALLEAVLSAEPGLREAVKQRLEPIGCGVPPNLEIEVSSDSPLPEGATESDFELVASRSTKQPEPQQEQRRSARPPARLVMMKTGTCTKSRPTW
jgi:hypothetical protein